MAPGKVKRILLACGAGIVTSTIARKRVEELLNANGYEGRYEITQVSLAVAPEESRHYDFVVATSIAPSELHCPYVNGVPYLMGTGMESSNAEILRLMEQD